MEVTGKIKLINEEKTFGANGFRKRDLVLTTDEQYPQMLLIEFVQEKCDLLNSYTVGQDVTVAVNLRGREWINPEGEAKYFNAIQGWRIQPTQDAQPVAAAAAPLDNLETVPAAETTKQEPDDLPF